MLYALVDKNNTVVRTEDHADAPPALPPAKGSSWLPVRDTHPETAGPDEVLEGPSVTVTDTAVERIWSVRALTYGESLARCQAVRADADPPVGDQLDAAYKARNGDDTALAVIDAAIASVKTAYPKPEPETH